MSKEVKRFYIMPGSVPVLLSGDPAYTPMTNHLTDVHTVPLVLASDYDALLAERDALLGERDRPTRASADVLAERRRQVEREGWTPAHDDLYDAAELPRAAAAYVLNGTNEVPPCIWPFHSKWWKPRDGRANYVRAAALLLAEIERIDRAALQGAQP